MISLSKLFEIKIFKKDKYKNKFLIHEHFAKRAGHHFDIRIEHNGKLCSWATRYLPDLIDEKRKKILLIQQPDHELEWFDFEGEIEDSYGAGKVKIWDKGTVKKIKWTDKHLEISFKGTKLKGIFHLLQYAGSKKQHYLMFRKVL